VKVYANGTELPREGPSQVEFCVGQKIDFTTALDPPVSYQNPPAAQWSLSGNYVNDSSTSGSGGSVNYSVNSSLLTQPTTSCWYVGGGSASASVGLGLQFSNGQYVAVASSGHFNAYRPDARPKTTAYLSPLWYSNPRNAVMNLSGYDSLELTANPMEFITEIYSKYPGNADYVQLISGSTGSDLIPSWSTGNNAADNSVPYGGTVPINPNSWSPSPQHVDGPETVGGLSSVWVDYTLKAYLRFTPSGAGSIPITLVRVDWSWSAGATKQNGIWSINSYCPAPTFSSDSTFPYWTHIYSNPGQ